MEIDICSIFFLFNSSLKNDWRGRDNPEYQPAGFFKLRFKFPLSPLPSTFLHGCKSLAKPPLKFSPPPEGLYAVPLTSQSTKGAASYTLSGFHAQSGPSVNREQLISATGRPPDGGREVDRVGREATHAQSAVTGRYGRPNQTAMMRTARQSRQIGMSRRGEKMEKIKYKKSE